MLTTFLEDVKDFRRLQGQRYNTPHHTLLFSFMAICCNSDTYRQIGLFIETHFDKLSQYFNLEWEKAPHHTTIRNHIIGVDALELDAAFRAFTQHQLPPDAFSNKPYNHIAADGKTLCGSDAPPITGVPYKAFHFLKWCEGLF